MSPTPEVPDNPLIIFSGGQTGVDRGALDAALALRKPCGGWCPADRGAEDGPIGERYPLTPLSRGGYAARTRKNVESSDGTLILCFGTPSGGTLLTLECCRRVGKPVLVIDGARTSIADAVPAIQRFVNRGHMRILNVAGPRASEDGRGYEFARRVVTGVLAHPKGVERPCSKRFAREPGRG